MIKHKSLLSVHCARCLSPYNVSLSNNSPVQAIRERHCLPYSHAPLKQKMLRSSVLTAALALLLAGCLFAGSSAEVITVTNGEVEGDWGALQTCPTGSRAISYQTQNDITPLPVSDDTALNSIMLFCSDPLETNLTSSIGVAGTWEPRQNCVFGSYLVAFKLLVEPLGNSTDNTAANNMAFRCSNGREISGRGNEKGFWGDWSAECAEGICGIETRVRSYGGNSVDDTALNDVRFTCCSTADY